MPVIHSKLKSFPYSYNEDCIKPLFSYPNLVFFEDKRIRVVNVDIKSEDAVQDQHDKFHKFDYDIIDGCIQDYLLWILFCSGEIIVINLLNNAEIKVKYENYLNYRIREIGSDEYNLFLLSDSGEYLSTSFTKSHIVDSISKEEPEIKISLQKANTHSERKICKSDLNGMYSYIEKGKLFVLCPITGINEHIPVNTSLEHILPWCDMSVLTNKTKMWIVDMHSSHIIHETEDNQGMYLPLATYNNILYYTFWDETQVHVCCAQISSTSNEILDYTGHSTPKLSSQENLKLQLKNLISMCLSSSHVQSEEFITELRSFFDKIDDFKLLLNAALELCQFDVAHKVLLYSLQRFSNVSDNINDLLSDAIIKVELLEYIQFRGNNHYKDINIFPQNVVELCTTFISNSDFDLACICWLKYSENKFALTSEDITKIMYSAPHNIKMSSLVIWLKQFLPTVLEENPFFIDLLVRWTTERVFLLEKSGYWPKIGLKFIEEIIVVLEKSLRTITVRPISMDDLDVLKDRILYIIELKENYKINMLLGELSSMSPSEIALVMLRRCYIEDLQAFLQNYLPFYAASNSFDMDKVLHTYIKTEAASSGGVIDGLRLQTLLNVFQSPTNKYECLLQVLKVLDVPWNHIVTNLAIDAAASISKDFTLTDVDRALVQNIQTELNYANIKLVLKKHNFSLTCTDYTLVLHRVMNASNVDLNDLKIISKAMNSTNYTHILYIDRRLRDCETRAALNYFKDLPNKEKKILLKTTTIKYEQIINNGVMHNITIERNYLDFLKGTQMLNDVQVTAFENMYHLKNSYGIKLNARNLQNEKLYAQGLELLNKDESTMSSDNSKSVVNVTQGHTFRNAALTMLLHRTSTNQELRKFVEAVITMSSKDMTLILTQFSDGNNISILVQSISVLVELIINCSEEYLHYLIRCLSILQVLINSDLSVKNLSITWKFHYIFLPILSTAAGNILINFYSSNILQNNSGLELLHTCNGNDFTLFRMLAEVMKMFLVGKNMLSHQFFNIRDELATKFISKIVMCYDIDEVLLTCLLLLLESNKVREGQLWILDILRGQSESISPHVMYYLSSPFIRRSFTLDNIISNNLSRPPQHILKSKFNLNLAEIVIPDITEETWDAKVVLFYVLKQYPDTNLERLMELCRALSIPLYYGLSLQLITLMSTWNLEYKILNDSLGCRQIHYENDEKELWIKCMTIWESINNKEFIIDVLTDFWKNGDVTLHGRGVSINPYYYEVYLCIYRLIFASEHNMKEYFLINFLKDYRRHSNPKQYEFELFTVKGVFPEVGYYRLPFHLFMRDDMWSHLKSEITLETYERWLPITALLSLDVNLQTSRDMICSNALKQTMTSRKQGENTNVDSSETEPWRLISREQSLLRSARRCVKYIANMEWAGACLFYVLQGCTRGADQVAAAQLCYQFAQRWAALQPGNRAVRQMERLHSTLSTRHILHKIEWASEEFIRLSVEPVQLIRALYLHPDFVEKMMRHDINRAANEIADKTGINISSIRIQILENILEKSQEECKKKSVALNIKELMTAKYILKATCPKMGAIYLSRIAFDDDGDFNKSKKLRALQCLVSVVEQDTAVKVANKERDTLWLMLLESFYVATLENIDVPWIGMTFKQDKTRALEQLVQAVKGSVEALIIAAKLAYRFGSRKIIYDIIPLLLQADLHEETIPLLKKVSSTSENVIFASWRTIMLSPFRHADYPITERQRLKCLNAVNLLPVCPVINDEDLLEIWKNCIRCKIIGIGCLILPYMTPQTRHSLTELLNVDKRSLIANLKNLHNETYLVSGAMYIIEKVMTSRGFR